MKIILKSLLIIILFTSCYTQRVAEKQVLKANFKHPLVTSGFCAVTFPVKEKTVTKTEFIKGETITKIDTLTVDCDSIVNNKDIDNKVLVKYRNIFRTDTIVKKETILKENTAKVTNLNLKISGLETENTQKQTVIDSLKKEKSKLFKWLIAFILATITLFFLIFKR